MKICIIGGGIMGMMTALEAATRFKRKISKIVLFDAGYPGSSIGDLRAIQNCYQGVYGHAIREARKQWKKILGPEFSSLYYELGNLLIHQHRYVVPKDSSCRLGPTKDSPVFDTKAGLFPIGKIHDHIRDKLNKLGVQFHWKSKVRHLDTKEKKIWYRKHKNKLTFCTYDRCILAAGAWINQILKNSSMDIVPYRISLEQINRFHIPLNHVKKAKPTHNVSGDHRGDFCYMYPPIPKKNFSTSCYQVVVHIHPQISTDIDIKQIKDQSCRPDLLFIATEFLQKYVSQKDQEKINDVTVYRCPYTHRDDGTGDDFIVSPLPNHPDIIVMAGYRGEGYKFSPVLGKLAVELATGFDPVSTSDKSKQKQKYWGEFKKTLSL